MGDMADFCEDQEITEVFCHACGGVIWGADPAYYERTGFVPMCADCSNDWMPEYPKD